VPTSSDLAHQYFCTLLVPGIKDSKKAGNSMKKAAAAEDEDMSDDDIRVGLSAIKG